MTDLAGAVAGLPPDNSIRVGTVRSVNPLVVDVGGGPVRDAGRIVDVMPGDRVACIRQGQTWLVLGRISPADLAQPVARAALTFPTGWENYGSGFILATAYRDASGMVTLAGLIRQPPSAVVPTGTVMANVPAGFRPGGQATFACNTNNNTTPAGRVDVAVNGDVVAQHNINSGFVGLGTIRYLAEN